MSSLTSTWYAVGRRPEVGSGRQGRSRRARSYHFSSARANGWSLEGSKRATRWLAFCGKRVTLGKLGGIPGQGKEWIPRAVHGGPMRTPHVHDRGRLMQDIPELS